ncbi:MAG: sigma-70 family RNA polymerase sigma factor [Phycisphaeraceae bacterium]|nr:sigma-70 family RNA polymerase sigma factor [Phycisphaeraceae bacterium]
MANQPTKPNDSDARARLAELWHNSQPSVSAYLFASVPNHHDAEDLLGQVAVAVARDFDQYDESQPFVRWAVGIARHRVLNYRRKYAMSKIVFSQETVEALANAVPVEPIRQSDFKAALKLCMGKLQTHARKAVTLRYENDLRPRHIANEMDMTPNAVSILLHRSRKALADCVQDSMEG